MTRLFIKINLIIASLALATSCILQEEPMLEQAYPVSFQMAVDVMSKADDSSIYPEDGRFMSVAYLNDTQGELRSSATYYITPSEVALRNNVWTTEVTYYWPETGYLTFLSYSPSTLPYELSMDRNGISIPGWDVVQSPDTDFMVADVAVEKTSSNSATGVPTVFRHKLAKITVSAKIENTGSSESTTEITIKKVTFNNICTRADYTGGTSTEGTWTDLANGWTDTWTPVTGAGASSSVDVFTSTLTAGTALQQSEEFTQLGDSYLMIPQQLSEATSLDIAFTEDGQDRTISLNMSGTTPEWQIGHSIHYTLVFRVGNIEMGAVTGDWSDASGGSITIGDKIQ